MARVIEYEDATAQVQIVVDDGPGPTGASSKAGTSDLSLLGAIKSRVPLETATQIVGQLADAFSMALDNCANRPNTVEVAFGLEASGEIGNFLVSKISGKTNFTVTLTWNFESPKSGDAG